MRRVVLLLVLAALALLAAGCGSSTNGDQDAVETDPAPTTEDTDTNEETEVEAAPVAASQIVQQFRASGQGAQLQEAAGQDPSWEQLGLGLDASAKELRTFGTFTIYVVDPENEEAVTSLLSDKDTAQPLAQSADGIYWDFDELAGSQVAYKRYGSNVVLAWWNERRRPSTDERWERLDALLESATSG
jgi:hypothetical protein